MFADFNVEYDQLVLFLLYSLNLMQKKFVLFITWSGAMYWNKTVNPLWTIINYYIIFVNCIPNTLGGANHTNSSYLLGLGK